MCGGHCGWPRRGSWAGPGPQVLGPYRLTHALSWLRPEGQGERGRHGMAGLPGWSVRASGGSPCVDGGALRLGSARVPTSCAPPLPKALHARSASPSLPGD